MHLGDSPPATLPNDTRQRPSVALFAALAAVFLVGCFLGSVWWFGADSRIAETTAANTVAGVVTNKDHKLDTTPLPTAGGLELPELDTAPDALTANGALVEKSVTKRPTGSSMAVMAEENDGDAWDSIPTLTGDTDASPTLVDVNKEFDNAVKSTLPGSPPFIDAKNLEDQKVEIAGANGPIWDSQLEWNLHLRFHRNGVGSATLNRKPIHAIFLQDNAVFLLRQIASELQRRVEFMENRLGSKVNGSISVEETEFRFDDIAQLEGVVKKVDRHMANLNIRALSLDELMLVRAEYRAGIITHRNKFDAVDLADKNMRLFTEDEAFTICSVLSTSEALLRALTQKRLAWEEDKEIHSTESQRAITITPREFEQFAKSGLLHLPDPRFSDQSIASVQHLGPLQLMQMLHAAPSVELFRNDDEFQKAKDYVYSNGPPEMQIRHSIDKLDRKLEDKNWRETMGDLANQQKSKLLRDLRAVLRQGGNFGDGVAMQPLKNVLAERTDLHGLPLTMGTECQSDADETRDLQQVSSSVGRTIGAFNGSLGSRDAAQNDALRNLSIKQMVSFCLQDHAENPASQKLKTIDQILQIDHPRLRLEMINSLRKSGSDTAVEILVDKAKFDLQPEVREAAIEGLANVPPEKFRQPLLQGLNYPWHVVAEHSAEALVRLNDMDAIPALIDMLDLPHPQSPVHSDGRFVQREMVGINHMKNCLLCHAPSISQSDSVRGLIPHSSRPLPPLYYDPTGGATDVPFAVRADITYLEQDFSVVLPVENAGPWPREQRFDFVVQQKKLTAKEAHQAARRIIQSPNRNRNAVVFALRELTGETPANNSSDNWRSIMASRHNSAK